MATLTSTPVAHETGTPPAMWRDVYILAGLRGLSFAGDIVAAVALTLMLQSNGAGSYAIMALLLAASVPPALSHRSPAASPTASTAGSSSSRSLCCKPWSALR